MKRPLSIAVTLGVAATMLALPIGSSPRLPG